MSSDNETFLYLTTTGHITGKTHEIEIWYVAFESRYYLVSEHYERSHWVQNIHKTPSVHFTVGTRQDKGIPRAASARPLNDADERLARKIRSLMDQKYNWSEGLIIEISPQDLQ